MAVYPVAYVGLPITADFMNKSNYDFTLKQSGTARANNTMADDPELAGIALPVGTHHVRAMYLISTAANSVTPDFRVLWSFTGTWSGIRGELGPASSNASPTAVADMTVLSGATGTARTYGSASSFSQVIFEEAYVTVTVAGSMAINWAQVTTDANATSLGAGSFVCWKQIA